MIILGEVIHAGPQAAATRMRKGQCRRRRDQRSVAHRLVYDSRRPAAVEPRIGRRGFGKALFLRSLSRSEPSAWYRALYHRRFAGYQYSCSVTIPSQEHGLTNR
jgi:hypothetical protein